ncbi:sensor histidine kinase [Caulobacter sp. CCUG 60055]|uniref:sensor histidine kinase n=1 Tax=Caulobacter sp. CCUG 60055 TaxID=2100090 RepID=UPI001FA6F8E1|nr:HAMP domain-containing sensor histidine kinase [Caulobacter sp. CCUG 60055]MBQ1541629.1 HAMP domain-containing histidine kinase [Caulobacteraceae bacterium]MCI3181973.1 sensor histidine kinase [Caulobacter sp. CCUG 60055]
MADPVADDSPPLAEEPDKAGQRARRLFWPGGLSSRLLILTVLFVALAELLILPPALAQFEEGWLLERVRTAEVASVGVELAPDQVVSSSQASKLLNGAGVVLVAVQSDGVRRLLLASPLDQTPYLVDLRENNLASVWSAPFQTLFGGEGRMVRVVAKPRYRDGDFIEIVAPDAPLRKELVGYLIRLLTLTALTTAVAGAVVYLSLNAFLVRPMQRITRAMERFRADPDDPRAHIQPSNRRDEIGRAEAELDRMQADLRAALNSRARLAALGEAVAKINHDLRNMLTSAQIASERLALSGDPRVAQALPRLERALDRAVTLASDVLAYGRSQETAPNPGPVALLAAVDAAAEDAGLSDEGVRLWTDIDPGEAVSADSEQLHRILVNLLRNAREAIEGVEGRAGKGEVRVSLDQDDGHSLVRLADNGPGVPERAIERLFLPFGGSAKSGGTGLGLAIARELAQGHGGDLTLAENGPSGAVFLLRLPGVIEPETPPRTGRRPRTRTA